MKLIFSLNTLQVAILEIGEKGIAGIGVVNEGYDTSIMPGWEDRTVGYLTNGGIYHAESGILGSQTKGINNKKLELSMYLILLKNWITG